MLNNVVIVVIVVVDAVVVVVVVVVVVDDFRRLNFHLLTYSVNEKKGQKLSLVCLCGKLSLKLILCINSEQNSVNHFCVQ